MWNERKDCQNIVKKIRSASVAGCTMLALQKKLKALKAALIERNKGTVGNVLVQVAQLQENLKSYGNCEKKINPRKSK